MNKYMNLAIAEAEKGFKKNHGGPFGAVVVKDGKVIGKGHNSMISKKDPTAHAEMEAIRDACKNLKTYNLSGCEIYTVSEPCVMCLGAILLANIKKCYFGCTLEDTKILGMSENNYYNNMEVLHDQITKCIDRDECVRLFQSYNKK